MADEALCVLRRDLYILARPVKHGTARSQSDLAYILILRMAITVVQR